MKRPGGHNPFLAETANSDARKTANQPTHPTDPTRPDPTRPNQPNQANQTQPSQSAQPTQPTAPHCHCQLPPRNPTNCTPRKHTCHCPCARGAGQQDPGLDSRLDGLAEEHPAMGKPSTMVWLVRCPRGVQSVGWVWVGFGWVGVGWPGFRSLGFGWVGWVGLRWTVFLSGLARSPGTFCLPHIMATVYPFSNHSSGQGFESSRPSPLCSLHDSWRVKVDGATAWTRQERTIKPKWGNGAIYFHSTASKFSYNCLDNLLFGSLQRVPGPLA